MQDDSASENRVNLNDTLSKSTKYRAKVTFGVIVEWISIWIMWKVEMKHPTTFYWLLFDISLSLRILFFFAFLFHFCTIKFPSRFIGLAQQVQVNRWVTLSCDDLRCKRIIKVANVDLKFKVAERDEIFFFAHSPLPSSVAAARYPLSHNPSKLRLSLTFFSVADSHVCFSHILEDSYTRPFSVYDVLLVL